MVPLSVNHLSARGIFSAGERKARVPIRGTVGDARVIAMSRTGIISAEGEQCHKAISFGSSLGIQHSRSSCVNLRV